MITTRFELDQAVLRIAEEDHRRMLSRLNSAEIDDATLAVAKSMGVSKELLTKYNGADADGKLAAARAGIDDVTLAMMRQCGVSMETFLKYNS